MGDNKETEGPQSVGGRNGDQYGTTVRQGSGGGGGGRQTEPEKRGGVTEGETEQKMDTVWQYGTGREGGGGEQGESGTREAGWEESTL